MQYQGNETYIVSPRIRTKNNLLMFSFGATAYNNRIAPFFHKDRSGLSTGMMLKGKHVLQPIFDRKATLEVARAITENFLRMSQKQFVARQKTYDAFIEEIFQDTARDFSVAADASPTIIFSRYQKLAQKLERLEQYSAPLGITCFYTPYLPDRLQQYLSERNMNEAGAYEMLTQMERVPRIFKEEYAWKRRLKKILKRLPEHKRKTDVFRSEAAFKKFLQESGSLSDIEKHFRTYRWMGYVYNAPGFDLAHYLHRALQDLKRGPSAEHRSKNFAEIAKQKKQLVNRLGIDKKYERLFRLLSAFIFHHTEDQTAYAYLAGMSESLLRTIGRRLRLSSFEMRYLLPDEVKNGLFKQTGSPILKKIARERILRTFLFYRGKKCNLFSGHRAKKELKRIFGVSDPISNFEHLWKNAESTPEGLSGKPACAGEATGRVVIIGGVHEAHKMQDGRILVAPLTVPQLLPIMKMAKAILTDMGGITSHAAIVSRELQIPCIVGMGNATKKLHDGDLVKVDANRGIVQKLS